MTKICPVCNRQQCETSGIWIAIDDAAEPDRPNYYMCSDCFDEARKSYRDSIERKAIGYELTF